jgi:hypothetical protein
LFVVSICLYQLQPFLHLVYLYQLQACLHLPVSCSGLLLMVWKPNQNSPQPTMLYCTPNPAQPTNLPSQTKPNQTKWKVKPNHTSPMPPPQFETSPKQWFDLYVQVQGNRRKLRQCLKRCDRWWGCVSSRSAITGRARKTS